MKDSLGNECVSIGSDLAEVALDTLVTATPGVLQSIPVAGFFVSAAKAGMAVRDYRFAKKIIVFIDEFNRLKLEDEKIKKFKDELDSDPNYASKVMESVSNIVDRLFDEEKAKIAGTATASEIAINSDPGGGNYWRWQDQTACTKATAFGLFGLNVLGVGPSSVGTFVSPGQVSGPSDPGNVDAARYLCSLWG